MALSVVIVMDRMPVCEITRPGDVWPQYRPMWGPTEGGRGDERVRKEGFKEEEQEMGGGGGKGAKGVRRGR